MNPNITASQLQGLGTPEPLNKSVDPREPQSPATVHPSGALSSACPNYHMIPIEALDRLAFRFMLGAVRYGSNNWRAGLTDKSFILDRLNHVIRHAYKLIDQIEGRAPSVDDDAGAILWAGAFMACVDVRAVAEGCSDAPRKAESPSDRATLDAADWKLKAMELEAMLKPFINSLRTSETVGKDSAFTEAIKRYPWTPDTE